MQIIYDVSLTSGRRCDILYIVGVQSTTHLRKECFGLKTYCDKYGEIYYLKHCETYDTVEAIHSGDKIVGTIQFLVCRYESSYQDDCNVAYPQIANIDSNYQRRGIATAMIEYAKELYDEVVFARDEFVGGNTDDIHYSNEGLAFKNSCERKGITRALVDDDN